MTTMQLIEDLREKAKVLCGEGLPITCDLFLEAAERLETLQKQLDITNTERDMAVKDIAKRLEEDGYCKQSEVAGEIFEEIDKNFILIPIYDIEFKELKKKYVKEREV